MMTSRTAQPVWRPVCTVIALLALAAGAQARTLSKAEVEDAKARHRAEVSLCNAGQTIQSRTDCIADADGALRVALRGDADSDREPYERNRKLRCMPLPEELRKDCLARMNGQGSMTGSVEAGGIYRELVTVEIEPQPDPPSDQLNKPIDPLAPPPPAK